MYEQEMRVLLAEESMQGATVTAVGTGSIKRSEISRLRSAWQREALRERRRAMSKDQMKAAAAAIGIGWTKG